MKFGKLRTVRTIGNQRRNPIEEIWRLRSLRKRAEHCVFYARVSRVRQEQDGHLVQQTARLKQAFRWKDVRPEVYEPPKHQQPTEELIQDM